MAGEERKQTDNTCEGCSLHQWRDVHPTPSPPQNRAELWDIIQPDSPPMKDRQTLWKGNSRVQRPIADRSMWRLWPILIWDCYHKTFAVLKINLITMNLQIWLISTISWDWQRRKLTTLTKSRYPDLSHLGKQEETFENPLV